MAGQFKLADAYIQFQSQGKSKVDQDIEGVKGSVMGLSNLTGSIVSGNLISQAISKGIELLKDALVGMVSSAAEAELAHVRFAQAVRLSGEAAGFTRQELDMLVASEAKRTGDSRMSQEQAMATLLRYKNVQGGVLAEAFKMTNELAAGMGVNSVDAARQLGTALEDPVTGMRMLRSLGVVFNESQRKQIDSMVEQGNLLGAQRVILERINGTYGGMVEVVNGTLADGWADLKTSVTELGISLGMIVLPVLKTIVETVNSWIRSFMTFTSFVAESSGTIWELFKARALFAVSAMWDGFTGMFSALGELIQWQGNALVSVFRYAVETVWTFFYNLGGNIRALFSASQDWLLGKGFDPKLTGLTEGVKSIDELGAAIGAMPVYDPMPSDTTQAAYDRAEKLAGDVAKAWSKADAEQRNFMDEAMGRAGIGRQPATAVKAKVEVEIPKLLMGIRAADLGSQFQRMITDGEAKQLKATEATAANTKATADKIGQLADAAMGPGIKIANMGWA